MLALVSACNRQAGPSLSETLAWMDNTYNPRGGLASARGHGRTGWYSDENSTTQAPLSEDLIVGSTETFTHDGCQFSLHVQDDPVAIASRESYRSSLYTFNLRDIDPHSIKVSKYSHIGGLPCAGYDSEQRKRMYMNCDHAEIVFSTHNEAALIDNTTSTKLQGSDHESKGKSRETRAFFEVDDVEYADRFAKAFRHAVELCGGKSSPF